MKKLFLRVFFSMITVFLYASCQNEEVGIESQDPNFVSQQDVLQLVSQLQMPVESGLRGTTVYEQKHVNSIVPVSGLNDNTASCYVVNYENGGFMVMSADNRIAPVLAFSESGELPLGEELPDGLVEWLEETSLYVEEVKKSDLKQSGNVKDAWAPQAIQRAISIGDPNIDGIDKNGECTSTYKVVEPLLKTTWGQGVGYNDLVATNILTGQCSAYSNGKPPAGCVAVAMAQIMKYHQHPKSYNWSAMFDNTGSNETARLMADIGSKVKMKYGCEGSSAHDDDATSAFKNNFGYSSAICTDFEIDRVVAELNSKRPVFLSGLKEKQIIITFPNGGHAWVCDGYRRSENCEYDTNGNFTGTIYMYTTLHMNWGWGYSGFVKYDGWFAYNDWKVAGSEYNYNKKMIYNIKP